MIPEVEQAANPLMPDSDALAALDAVSNFEMEQLLRPPVAIAVFVRRLVRAAEYYVGPEQRHEPRYAVSVPVAAVPVDHELKKAGDVFIACTRDISASGIAMYHTRRVSEKYLALEIKSDSGERLRVLAEVLRCSPVGLFYQIAGKFVSRFDA